MVIGFFRGRPAFEHSFPRGRLRDAHGISVDAAWPLDPVAFAMDFLRGQDDSLPTSNEA